MTTSRKVPEFVIAGHPNEGKSSLLSTLAEDDSVKVSPYPGETKRCKAFPVKIDGQEIIRFVDTPGFQNPMRVLAWMRKYKGATSNIIRDFIASHKDDPVFRDDCELLRPMEKATGIIFVVDGSRPLRRGDKAEMEILRLIGRPRMAVINCKTDDSRWLSSWQEEFRRHFNSIRVFNSCKAGYRQRIELLESLKAIDQELSILLDSVISAIKADWAARRQKSAEIIASMLKDILGFQKQTPILLPELGEEAEKKLEAKLLEEYRSFAKKREAKAHKELRRIYKHRLLDSALPEHSILQEDLFSKKTWQFLGLSKRQLVIAGAIGGAAAGAMVDIGHGGLSMGLFSMAGGLIGGVGAAVGSKEVLAGTRLLGIRLDKESIVIGPANNIQLLYVLLDRALMYFSHITGWSHGRRDYENAHCELHENGKRGFTSEWSMERRRICQAFFKAVTDKSQDEATIFQAEVTFVGMLEDVLKEIAG
ncbi:MAG: GTPase/DUF3482 domain-containing protein [Thermodesulfobacteria bacterium]|nr:GTPase/DUF3482 domain-containing protein [Thermodesulfobacteriota bacterium]